MSAKHDIHSPSNARVIESFLSCHGNKVSMTGKYYQGTYAPNQKPISRSLDVQYRCVFLCSLGWQLSNDAVVKDQTVESPFSLTKLKRLHSIQPGAICVLR